MILTSSNDRIVSEIGINMALLIGKSCLPKAVYQM